MISSSAGRSAAAGPSADRRAVLPSCPLVETRLPGNHDPRKIEIANCRKTRVQAPLSCNSDYFIPSTYPRPIGQIGILHGRLNSRCLNLAFLIVFKAKDSAPTGRPTSAQTNIIEPI